MCVPEAELLLSGSTESRRPELSESGCVCPRLCACRNYAHEPIVCAVHRSVSEHAGRWREACRCDLSRQGSPTMPLSEEHGWRDVTPRSRRPVPSPSRAHRLWLGPTSANSGRGHWQRTASPGLHRATTLVSALPSPLGLPSRVRFIPWLRSRPACRLPGVLGHIGPLWLIDMPQSSRLTRCAPTKELTHANLRPALDF
jgi:hypothetical protein